MTIPSDGSTSASTISTIATINVNGGSTVTASKIYNVEWTGSYSLSAGHQVYACMRYTSGSGNKYSYGSATLGFTLY